MKHVFWIEEGRVAGRCGPWREPFDMDRMQAAGIGCILSLDSREAALIPDGHPDMERMIVHLPDSIPPSPEDKLVYRQRVPQALAYLMRQTGGGRRGILVHCHAGNDRTGTILAAWLMATRKMTPEQAIAAVRAKNPDALSAAGYEEMALEILASLAAR